MAAAEVAPEVAQDDFEAEPVAEPSSAPQAEPGSVTVRHAEGGESVLTAAEAEMFASRIERGELVIVQQ